MGRHAQGCILRYDCTLRLKQGVPLFPSQSPCPADKPRGVSLCLRYTARWPSQPHGGSEMTEGTGHVPPVAPDCVARGWLAHVCIFCATHNQRPCHGTLMGVMRAGGIQEVSLRLGSHH